MILSYQIDPTATYVGGLRAPNACLYRHCSCRTHFHLGFSCSLCEAAAWRAAGAWGASSALRACHCSLLHTRAAQPFPGRHATSPHLLPPAGTRTLLVFEAQSSERSAGWIVVFLPDTLSVPLFEECTSRFQIPRNDDVRLHAPRP